MNLLLLLLLGIISLWLIRLFYTILLEKKEIFINNKDKVIFEIMLIQDELFAGIFIMFIINFISLIFSYIIVKIILMILALLLCLHIIKYFFSSLYKTIINKSKDNLYISCALLFSMATQIIFCINIILI